ncbi:ArsR/SmtB family transcription factor [Acidisphaera rubrifaciens]|uniref:Transcriptional regulator ArsR/methyltransferase n=1 Tax=Acidisphaera rubrifaciens HS-AP3 TaxID=1231350 RepID=A0A0D6P646_9PROT|nr:metalloregulator ArsR/SmtB family transcription factor [Acidisphaera rubrifaciens]GAN76816.1 transcriptional regulator ArsR/methyltransferase [Acidisphaera rubrifaciens HS-AP3]
MDSLLAALRAAAEPTRLRLLALAGRGAFCVTEFCEILGQSQPRLSRHLKLMTEAGLLERVREGANAWYALPSGDAGDPAATGLARDLAARLPDDDAVLAADARQAARVLAERARAASETFRRQGADWDEMRALDLPAAAVEQRLLDLLPDHGLGRLLDIGTGTGRLLEVLAPRVAAGLGIDASKAMLALARTRLAGEGLGHCSVRQGDMYRMPLADASFDLVTMHMVLHYAEDPAGAIAEAARVLRPGGRLIIVELAAHDRADVIERFAHRWSGFSPAQLAALLGANALLAEPPALVDAPLPILVCPARRSAEALPARLSALAV